MKSVFVLSFAPIKNQKAYYSLILVFVFVFSIFCAYQLRELKFDYEFEAFFPNEDHELEVYHQFRETFGHDNEFVLIALENREGIFRKDFLLRIDSLAEALSKLEFVKKVSSPTNIKRLSLSGFIPLQSAELNFEDPSLYQQDSLRIYSSPHLVGSFFPPDAKSLSIYVNTAEGLSKTQSDALAENIENTIGKFSFEDSHFVGRIFAQNVYLKHLQEEFGLFMALSFIMIVIFLWISFRSLYGIAIPVCIVLISILWTLGIMGLTGKPIDLMTVMLPTMIFIAGMSDVVHFFTKYSEELAKGTERNKIYQLIVKEVGFPTFLTLVTTVVGFLSLLFSSITPIREFGIYTSVGVIIAFILTYTLLPALLFFFNPKKIVRQPEHNNRPTRWMRAMLFVIFKNQKTILSIGLIIVVLSVIGISKIKVNNILLEDLSERVKIKQDFIFFEKHYSGVRPFEMQVSLPNSERDIWDYEIIKEINKVDTFIKSEYEAGLLLSPASLVRNIYQNSMQSNGIDFPDKEDYEDISKYLKDNKKNKDLRKIVNPENSKARISAKIKDMGSIQIAEHNKNLFTFIRQQVDTNLVKFELTGAAHLVDRNNKYMVSNMIKGFVFSLIVVALLTLALHRSWKMVLVFLLPNMIPLLVVAGIMGYWGIELKAATSLVFSIAFGIATDDTIHFISRLKIELGYGKRLIYAFKRTYFETGKPIILTTFILMGGFISLMSSDFQSIYYFGLLICITVFVAGLADIFLLPVLLFLIYRKKQGEDPGIGASNSELKN